MGLRKKEILNKPRLLIILNRFVIGGQAVDTIPLAYYLQGHFEILILFGEKEPDEIEPSFLLDQYPGLQLKKIRQIKRNINPFIDVLAFFRLLKVILSFKPHIVHTHGAKSGFLGRLAAWLCQVPVIIHSFHGHFFHSYFSKKISNFIAFVERCMGKITTAAIALSEALQHDLTEEFKILPSSKIKIIPLGFAFDMRQDTQQLRDTFRNRYGLQKNDIAIGIVGRIVPIKNHYFFLQVIHHMLHELKMKNVAFFIIGDGELRNSLENQLNDLQIPFSNSGVNENCKVVFTSWIMDIYEVMNGLDIVSLTSLNEGTPLSLIEAQFFGKPVVATHVGGVKDTIKDGITGFLAKNGDVAGFATKLKTLVENENLRMQMGDAGTKLAWKDFSKQTEVKATQDFYFSLLRNKGFVIPFTT